MELILRKNIEKLADGSYRVEREKLDIGASLLTQFVEKSKDKQIECLKVVHHIMNELEHPSGCLNDILSCLYDNFALSKSAFFKWHDDNDPLEQEGKGMQNIFLKKSIKLIALSYDFFFLYLNRCSCKKYPSLYSVLKKRKG